MVVDLEANQQVHPNTNPIELRDRLDLGKDKKVTNEKREDDYRKIKCFRCQEVGHHQKDYMNSPICYKCKEEGHMATECVNFHAKTGDLRMYGFAI
jgi:hypothetical protein